MVPQPLSPQANSAAAARIARWRVPMDMAGWVRFLAGGLGDEGAALRFRGVQPYYQKG
jgi:hypothetical protein